MSVSLERLVFNPAEAAEGANVGAYIRGKVGNVVDSTTIGGFEWLRTVSAMFDGAGNALSSTSGALNVNISSGSLAVDVVHTSDSVRLGDGTNFLTSTTVGADIGLDVNIINASMVVSATDLDIRDLTHVSDSVKLGDGTNLLTSTTVGADIGLDVNIINSALSINDAALANTAISNEANSVTTAEENLVGTVLSNRKYLLVQNLGEKACYIGATGVTAANGFRLSNGAVAELRAGAAVTVKAITASGTADMRILQLS
jgi:hypothetical protein